MTQAGFCATHQRFTKHNASPVIAIRPPEYWPSLAYMALIDQADVCVLADTFQYSRQSFQNRARLRTPDGWQWVSVPLQGGQHGRRIEEVVIWQRPQWLRKHARAFMYNYRSSPYYDFYEPAFAAVFAAAWTHLGALTCATVELLHHLLGLGTRLVRASALPGPPRTLADVRAAFPDRPLLVPQANARHDAHSTDTVVAYAAPPYRQNFNGFEAGMSAVDVLFNYGPEARSIIRQGLTLHPITPP